MFTLFGGIVTALGLVTAVVSPEPVKTVGEGALLAGTVGTITHVATGSSPAGIVVGALAGTAHVLTK